MIRGHCHTNLDEYNREEWPDAFVAIPNKGDRVRAKSGKTLKVVSVTHTIATDETGGADGWPLVLVELHHG